MAPDIQFVARPLPWRGLAGALCILSMALTAATSWHYVLALKELSGIEEQIADQQRRAEGVRAEGARRSEPAISEARLNAINAAIARLNIPWPQLFAAFESNKSGDVALLALLPDARKRVLLVQAEARTPQAMIAFVTALRNAPGFEDAYLTKHERRPDDAGQPYRFAVEMRWKGER
jgi:hypothetical protein